MVSVPLAQVTTRARNLESSHHRGWKQKFENGAEHTCWMIAGLILPDSMVTPEFLASMTVFLAAVSVRATFTLGCAAAPCK